MAEYVYTIAGKSKEKPENLPEGFTVVEDRELVKQGIGLVYVSENLNPNFPLYLSVDERGLTMSRSDAVLLRDTLNRIIDDPTKMRVVQDMDDHDTNTWRWFEVAPDQFVYARNRPSAMDRYQTHSNVGMSLKCIKEEYGGIRTTEWEV